MRRHVELSKQAPKVAQRLTAAALFLVTALLRAAAQQAPANQVAPQSEPGRRVVVSLPDRKLALVVDRQVTKVYAVAVGKPSTPSPTGEFKIVTRVVSPTYYHEGVVIPPGPDNPIGARWIGLNQKGYGIHGTNAPRSIGKAASHGCIRVGKRDLEELFQLVRPGDVVEIHGERDAQVAQIFAAPASTTTVASAQSVAGAAGGQF